jgi:putative ABC transport system permease protein
MRTELLREIVAMAFDTVRTNKLRSGLTVLGVVIGITSIVGMTSLVRGFDESLRDSIRELGPNTVFVAKFSGLSFAAGREFTDLMKRPTLTESDARAIEKEAPSVGRVDVWLGAWGQPTQERAYYRGTSTKTLSIMGATQNFSAVNFVDLEMGRLFNEGEVQRRRRVAVLGQTPYLSLFPNVDPIGKQIRIGGDQYTVVGVFGTRPSPGGFGGADDFIVIPSTTHQKVYGGPRGGRFRFGGTVASADAMRSAMIAAVPRDDASRDQMIDEIREVMRIRHGLRLDEPDDFDVITQDAALQVWEQFSQATFLALVVISSIALMVGGIGVMAIMTISVTERTREIGVRKALGAKRREILWQFLAEGVFLTSAGGLLGILLGSGIGLGVHWASGFPVSLPWWSFALGIGFSASVGIFFGLWPAIRASRLDPIEALRYE